MKKQMDSGNLIDVHSHILPGVDDGAQDWEQAEAMLRMAYSQGISKIIATPHFRKRQNTRRLYRIRKELEHRAKEISEEMEIYLGQEIMYFEELPQYLDKGAALTLAGSKYVLIEFMPLDSFSKISRAVRILSECGYMPVVAHCERYQCLHRGGKTQELIDLGAYLQINYHSLELKFPLRRTMWARKELKEGRCHLLGTDMHNTGRRSPEITRSLKWLEKGKRSRILERVCRENPQCILENRAISL